MTIWLECFPFREFRVHGSIINTVKCLNLVGAAETKSGSSRDRPVERAEHEGWFCYPELQSGKALTGIAEIKELESVWQPLILMAEPDGCFPQEHLVLELYFLPS